MPIGVRNRELTFLWEDMIANLTNFLHSKLVLGFHLPDRGGVSHLDVEIPARSTVSMNVHPDHVQAVTEQLARFGAVDHAADGDNALSVHFTNPTGEAGVSPDPVSADSSAAGAPHSATAPDIVGVEEGEGSAKPSKKSKGAA